MYLLLNKDIPVLRFRCRRNEYEDVFLDELEWFTQLRPIGYTGLQSFLEHRKAPKRRKHMEPLMERHGCRSLDDFLKLTHALSLNDTYWVRAEDSPLTWQEVSLYRNRFDEAVAAAALDGTMGSMDGSGISPEWSTDGHYAKCWVREPTGVYLYKRGSAPFEREPLSEYLTSQLADAICPHHVPYDMEIYRGRPVSRCPLFTDEATGLVKASRVTGRDRTIVGQLSYFESIGSGEEFRRMCVLDALTLNDDRHLGNFGVLVDNDTQQILSMAPVYDNNRSLLFDLDADRLASPDFAVREKRPALGTDFIGAARGLMTPEIRQDLLNLKGFTFRQHPRIPVEQQRLTLLEQLVQVQLKRIIAEV